MRGRVDDETLIGWLRGMLSALAQPRAGEQRVFVKFHAWHVLELPFIARAFPDVPWVFVFREPRAVLQSQTRSPGAEVVIGTLEPVSLGLDAGTARSVPQAEYAARSVAAFCDAALRYAGLGRSRFVDYARLPESVFTEVCDFFDVRARRSGRRARCATSRGWIQRAPAARFERPRNAKRRRRSTGLPQRFSMRRMPRYAPARRRLVSPFTRRAARAAPQRSVVRMPSRRC